MELRERVNTELRRLDFIRKGYRTPSEKLEMTTSLGKKMIDVISENFSRSDVYKILDVERLSKKISHPIIPVKSNERIELDYKLVDMIKKLFISKGIDHLDGEIKLFINNGSDREISDFIVRCNILECQGFFKFDFTRKKDRVIVSVKSGGDKYMWITKEIIDKYLMEVE